MDRSTHVYMGIRMYHAASPNMNPSLFIELEFYAHKLRSTHNGKDEEKDFQCITFLLIEPY